MLTPYRYWNRTRNSGDSIMAYILQNVLGVSPFQVAGDVPHLLGVGSIFFLANRNSYIWGSGVLRQGEIREIDPDKVRAVRGKKTLSFLRSNFPEVSRVPLGDPGILMEYLLQDPSFVRRPTIYKVAVIPHYKSINDPIFRDLAKSKEICIVDMHDDTLRPLELIQQSEIVVSQSLHGLIYAAALNKKYAWISRSNDDNWSFKFLDWFSTTENPQKDPISLDSSTTDWFSAAEFRPCTIDRKRLLNAFPEEMKLQINRPFVDFTTIRSNSPFIIRTSTLENPPDEEIISNPQGNRAGLYSKIIQKVVEDFKKNWSEMPYVVLCSPSFSPDRKILNNMTRFLDRHIGIECMAIFSKEDDRLSRAKFDKKITAKSFIVAKNDFGIGHCAIVRPSAKFELKKMDYAAFI